MGRQACNFSAVIPALKPGVLEDITGYFAQAKARHGHRLTSDQLCLFTDAWIADDKAAALREYGDYFLYFNQRSGITAALARSTSPRRQGTWRRRPTITCGRESRRHRA